VARPSATNSRTSVLSMSSSSSETSAMAGDYLRVAAGRSGATRGLGAAT
jgi:hypothetical protein